METASRNELVERSLPIARLVARTLGARLPPSLEMSEDLYGEACLLLVEAADLYDPARGVPFALWAKRYLFWRVMEAIRRKALRDAQHSQLAEDYDAAAPEDTEARAESNRRREIVNEHVRRLAPEDRVVVTLRYGRGRTMRQIGEAIGTGESRASQIHSAVLGRLRREWRLRDLAEAA